MLDSSHADERHDQGRLATQPKPPSRRPIVLALLVALAATALTFGAARLVLPQTTSSGIARGQPAPDITGTTLDGKTIRLADLRGRPVIVNFWGPSCIPCRSEFPLFESKLAEHAADGLAVVGVLMYDSPAEARAFVAEYGAQWPTVLDPDGKLRTAYQAVARPQTYFIDRSGVLRTIQIGEVVSDEFEQQYATIR